MLRIPRDLVDEIIAHARREAPDECWGLLAGQDDRVLGVLPCDNGAPPEERPFRYQVEPRSYLKAEETLTERGWEVLGVYHSHTHTQPVPSPTDIEESPGPKSLNPDREVVFVLVSLRSAGQPYVYRGMPAEAKARAHDFAQTRPARPEVAAFHIRDGRAEPVALRVTRRQRILGTD